MKKKILSAVALCMVVALLLLRWIGEQSFEVKPEPIPTVSVPHNSPLSKSVRQHRESQGLSGQSSIFYPLGDAHTALLTRFDLADKSAQSLVVQYYLFHDDESGRALLGNLINAASRGVKVRLLLDDMDTLGRDHLLARLALDTDNFELRVFNPTWLRSLRFVEYLSRFPRVTRRMHNKSFTVDSSITVVGGRNIGNEYFDVNTEVAFTDFDILAAGPVALDVTNEFNEYWHSGLAVDINQLTTPANDADYEKWHSQLSYDQRRFQDDLSLTSNLVSTELTKGSLTTYDGIGEVIYDRPLKVVTPLMDTNHNLGQKIIDLMLSAKRELLISSPYFIPGDVGMEAFKSLRDRDVRITVVTNSFEANDVPAVHAGYIDYRNDLLEMGVNVFEFKHTNTKIKWSLLGSNRASLHAKTFVVDQTRNYIGSFNLDPRSALHNTEMGIIFDNEAFGARATTVVRKLLNKHAYQLSLNVDGDLLWRELTEEGSTRVHSIEPGTTRAQRASVYLMSWLPVEWLL